jgi:hypothetical protein
MRRLVEKGLGRNICPTHFKGEEDDVTISKRFSRTKMNAT